MSDCTFVIFGASGDLAKRKLFPALYSMIVRKRLSRFIVVGAARDQESPDSILHKARSYMGETIDALAYQELVRNTYYKSVDFSSYDGIHALAQHVDVLEKQHALSGNRIIYCATASQFYCSLTEYMARAGLARNTTSLSHVWHRIVYEKPFGHDGVSAHEINECISAYFDESQIYRIDHYLTKELVDNIALIRFTNCVFEPLWNNRYIDHIQIVLNEQIGIEGRGAYYDHYGALSDVVQNHMLELVALIGMECPEQLTGEYIRKERAQVLEKISVVDALLGQYQGYQQEATVNPASTTETFALVALHINNDRWQGVPFFLKTGKCLEKKETIIHIKFKEVNCLLTKKCPTAANYLTIKVFPDSAFVLTLNAKKPGVSHQVVPIDMEFCHSCVFGPITIEAYEIIFEEIMKGEQAIAVRFDEIESAWKVIDAIKKMNLPVHTYQKDSAGPEQAEEFSKKYGIRWR